MSAKISSGVWADGGNQLIQVLRDEEEKQLVPLKHALLRNTEERKQIKLQIAEIKNQFRKKRREAGGFLFIGQMRSTEMAIMELRQSRTDGSRPVREFQGLERSTDGVFQ